MSEVHYQVVPFKAALLPTGFHPYIIEGNQAFHWSAEQTQADFANPYAEYYVLTEGTVPLGYIGLHKIFDEVTINQVFVTPAYRQQGLGKALLQFLLEQLTARKVKQIFLEVRVSNQAAIALYQSLDFEILTQRPDYYTQPVEDALIMHKRLISDNA